MSELTTPMTGTIKEKVDALLSVIPENQRDAAAALLIEFGPKLFTMTTQAAMNALKRLAAGDLEVAVELLLGQSDDEFLTRVRANTARWQAVEGFNIAQDAMKTSFIMKAAPVLVAILAAFVGL